MSFFVPSLLVHIPPIALGAISPSLLHSQSGLVVPNNKIGLNWESFLVWKDLGGFVVGMWQAQARHFTVQVLCMPPACCSEVQMSMLWAFTGVSGCEGLFLLLLLACWGWSSFTRKQFPSHWLTTMQKLLLTYGMCGLSLLWCLLKFTLCTYTNSKVNGCYQLSDL